MRAGLTPLETQRVHREVRRSLERRHHLVDETRKTLQVMVNAPTALRAYVLADAALVRGKLTLRQSAQVAGAETELKGCADRRSGQDEVGESVGSTETKPALARNPGAAVFNADTRLGLTQAAVLLRGESRSGYFPVLLASGFSREQVAEIIGSIALSTFSHYFAHAKAFETIA